MDGQVAKTQKKHVAVVGATGLVGQTIAQVLAERHFPILDYVPVATDASGGRRVAGFDKTWTVRGASEIDFESVDLCFFTAGARVRLETRKRLRRLSNGSR